MKINRRTCITGLASLAALPAQQQPQRAPAQNLELVKAFVIAGHSDQNLAKVKEYVAQDPKLVLAAWDWGGGDWETALGGASHIGSREMARYLLSKGARIDAFSAAMLGQRAVVAAMVTGNPTVATTAGPHGFTLLYHAAISGDVAMAELLKPHLAEQPKSYTQALGAAVRDGHVEMTRWLFANGDVNPNVPDFQGKTPLTLAIAKGYKEVAEELRKHGARETE